MKRSNLSLQLALAAGALVVMAASAQADITDPGLRITATTISGSSTFDVFLANGTWTTTYTPNDTWEWTGSYQLFDNDFNLIADVTNMHCKMIADPSIVVDFSVTAGALATNFTITSGVLSFAGIPSAQARASAAVTITDNDSDGASFTGNHAGPKGFRTNYNGAIPGGTVFANLISNFAAAPDDSNGSSQDSPAFGYTALGTTVTDMQSQWNFDLSANDSASGVSFYEIIPSPAAMTVLGAAGLFGCARRRRA